MDNMLKDREMVMFADVFATTSTPSTPLNHEPANPNATPEASPSLTLSTSGLLTIALVACLAVVIVGLGACVVWMLVRRGRTVRGARLPRRMLGIGAIALALLTAALGVILLANLSTVGDPARALAGFFGSGAS